MKKYIDSGLLENGIFVVYEKDGKEFETEIAEETLRQYAEENGWLECYSVTVDHTGNPVEHESTQEWEDFYGYIEMDDMVKEYIES